MELGNSYCLNRAVHAQAFMGRIYADSLPCDRGAHINVSQNVKDNRGLKKQHYMNFMGDAACALHVRHCEV